MTTGTCSLGLATPNERLTGHRRLLIMCARVDSGSLKSLSLSLHLSLSLPLSSWGWQGRAESEKGLSSPVLDQQRSFLCVCFVFPSCALCDCAHFTPKLTTRTLHASLSGFICDRPEASNGEGAATWRLQTDAIAASSASYELTTIAGTSGRGRRGDTTIASTSSGRAA